MDPIPHMVPISEFRSRQNKLLEKLSSKPILLTRRGSLQGHTGLSMGRI